MSYWGSQRPILKYGAAYGTTWNLETDDVNVYYLYKHIKDRNINRSALTNDAKYSELYSDVKYTSGEVILKFFDLTDAQVEKLLVIVQNATLHVQYHNDSPNGWYDVYIIKKFIMPAEEECGVPYPQNVSCYIELEKMTPDEIKNDTST